MSVALFVIFLLSLYLTSCAPPVFSHPSDWHFDFSFPYWGLPLSLFGLALYFLPTIIAAIRRSKSILGIVLVNIFTGWTFIGWVISLIWSLVGTTSSR